MEHAMMYRNYSRQLVCIGLFLALAIALLSCRMNKAQETHRERDPRALQEFHHRVENYVRIHHQAEQKSGLTVHLQSTHSGRDIVRRQHALAEHIAALRRNAREGEIFTPEVSAYFTQELELAYQGNPEGFSSSACPRETVRQDIRPNDTYPETWDYRMMAPTILLHIPPLPAELEYRIVNKHLIIRDIEANMIVDVMRNAITSLPKGNQCDD